MTSNARASRPTPTGMCRACTTFARDSVRRSCVPRYSRYVVDLNRPPDDTSLYPGQNTTGLCPAVQFTGDAGVSRRAGAGRGRGRRARRDVLAPVPRRAARRTRAACATRTAASCCGKATRSGQRPAVPVRWPPAGSQPRHRRAAPVARRRCRRGSKRVLAAQSELRLGGQRPLQGRLHHPPLRAPGEGIDAVQLEISQRIYMDEDSRSPTTRRRRRARRRCIRRLLEAAIASLKRKRAARRPPFSCCVRSGYGEVATFAPGPMYLSQEGFHAAVELGDGSRGL